MKKYALIILVYVFLINCYSINIEYKSTNEKDVLFPTVLNGLDYFSLNEIKNKLQTTNHYIDFPNGKVTFTLNNESIIVYTNTHLISLRGQTANLSYPIVSKNNDFYLPETFFSKVLTSHFPEKYVWEADTKTFSTEKQKDKRVKTIVIDPGHGGKDPGAVGKKAYEKNVVLEVAKKLKTQLEKEFDDIKVILTRNNDVFVPLHDRTTIANSNKADLFISLHCNAIKHKNVKGIEVYYLAPARTVEARDVAAFENSVVEAYEGGLEALNAYNDLQYILADLLQSEQLEESSDLSIRLQTELVNKTRAYDRGVKQADFLVLRGASMPAVLLELGFMSNEEEEKKLTDPKHQADQVAAIVNGIKSFKLKYDYLW
ncbi:MAG: N-acetylmuramoyl-L-alanine amidase [Candidatus Cloacimonetes bacterium]|nr:N-acetylmuramoyl-L-alanine amidase [Candidatus Cloacimonadota bacterium]